MTATDEFIDRIVAGVLAQLRSGADAAPLPPKNDVEISDDVVTAEVLEKRAVQSGTILLGTKSVLTPSARDFLAARKIGWTRGSKNGSPSVPPGRWLAIIVRSTPAVVASLDLTAKDADGQWSRELTGCHREAAKQAVGALCRGECDGVVAFTGQPEAVACHSNRNSKVRAATVGTAMQIKALAAQLGTNLFAINPHDRSVFELRSLLREIISCGKPAPPADWKE